jgi:hypothetical protein
MAPEPPRPEVDRSSVLHAWDEAILRCFAEIKRAPSSERAPSTLRMSRDCLRCLDDTLATLRGPRWSRVGGDEDLWALRSAAIEVATRSYVSGVGARQTGVEPRPRRKPLWDGPLQIPPNPERGQLERVVCALPRDLLAELDALTGSPSGRERSTAAEHLMAARSVAIESAVTAWLILRGYPAVAPSEGARDWRDTLRRLLRRR